MKCIYLKENNEKCKANAMKNGEYCYLHNPDIPSEERLDAQIRGGQNRGLKVIEPLRKLEVRDSDDIFNLLATTIQEVRAGEIDPRVANTVGYLAGITIKAYEVAKLEQRINELETALEQ